MSDKLFKMMSNKLDLLEDWQARALPWIKRECENLGEHIAMCRMELEQADRKAFKHDELIDPDLYLADIEKEHAEIRQLLIDAGVEV